jgi:hypothetical protein
VNLDITRPIQYRKELLTIISQNAIHHFVPFLQRQLSGPPPPARHAREHPF